MPAGAFAQNTQLESLLERSLSDDGRVVEIDGFSGAFSSVAKLDALRVSDEAGVWLELTDVSLNWSRAALLTGRLEVTSLEAQRVFVARAPQSTGVATPSAQATDFRIPDFPVTIQIDRVAAEEIHLAEPLLGETVLATLEARAVLADGGLDVALTVARTDTKPGRAVIELAYAPGDEALAVDISVVEPAGGVVAIALGLPGAPPVALSVNGAGPLDDFKAKIELATDGQERLAGTVSLTAQGEGRAFSAELVGDIRPLLEEGSRGFFGSETSLYVAGFVAADGAFSMDDLRLATAQLDLSGRAALDADGAPTLVSLTGSLSGAKSVLLPGTDMALQAADLSIGYDASQSEDWLVALTAHDIVFGSLAVERFQLQGDGVLVPAGAVPFDGFITATLSDVSSADPAIQRAIGSEVDLSAQLWASDDGSFSLEEIAATVAAGRLDGRALVVPLDGRFGLEAQLSTNLPDLEQLALLAGVPLAGQVAANVTLNAELPGGSIAVSLDGTASELDIGQPMFEPLLSPVSTLALSVTRDEDGTRVERFELRNPELTAKMSGAIASHDNALKLEAGLREIGLFTDLIEGPVDVDFILSDLLGEQRLNGVLSTEFGLQSTVAGVLGGQTPALFLRGQLSDTVRFVPQLSGASDFGLRVDLSGDAPVIDAVLRAKPGLVARVRGPVSGPDASLSVDLDLADAGAFLAQIPGPASVSGTVSELASGARLDLDLVATPGLTASVQGRPTGPDSELTITADARSLGFVSAQLEGAASAQVRLEDPTGAQRLSGSFASEIGVSGTISGQISAPNDGLTLTARLAELAHFAPGVLGGGDVSAQIGTLGGPQSIDANLRTDTGGDATLRGRVGLADGAVELSMQGTAPLGIAEAFVGERALEGEVTFDVSLIGAPELSGLNGTIQTRNARLFDPALDIELSPLTAQMVMADGGAEISLSGALADGGRVDAAGRVGLSAPYPLALQGQGRDLALSYQDVLSTSLSADLTLSGNVKQRLLVGGSVRIRDTEARVPDTGLGGAEAIPEITHLAPNTEVRKTLERAGLSLEALANAGAGGPTIPLDVTLVAETPIFVRGRGLNASFSGALTVGGTIASPVPAGGFSLERGRLDFLGRRLDLTDGQITMTGSFIPRIAIVASAAVEGVTAQIDLEGPIDAPELALSSIPELPEDEILARILFGRGIDTLSALQVAQLVSSVRTLSGAGGDGILERARQRLGVDDFDVRTDDETGETEIAIGQALTDDIYSEVELSSGGNTQINLNFDLSDNTTLRGSASSDGETGIGIFWEKDY